MLVSLRHAAAAETVAYRCRGGGGGEAKGDDDDGDCDNGDYGDDYVYSSFVGDV